MAPRTENWLPVPQTDYEASDQGGVRSERTKRKLKPTLTPNGVRTVSLTFSSRRKRGAARAPTASRTIASLVLLAYRGPKPDGMVARHIRARHDDRLVNLRWGLPGPRRGKKGRPTPFKLNAARAYTRLTPARKIALALFRRFDAKRTALSVTDASRCLKVSMSTARQHVVALAAMGYLKQAGLRQPFRLTAKGKRVK